MLSPSITLNYTGSGFSQFITSERNAPMSTQLDNVQLSYWWFSNLPARFLSGRHIFKVYSKASGPKCTKFGDTERPSMRPSLYFGIHLLMPFEVTAAQRRVGWKIKSKFRTFWSAVGHSVLTPRWILTSQRPTESHNRRVTKRLYIWPLCAGRNPHW